MGFCARRLAITTTTALIVAVLVGCGGSGGSSSSGSYCHDLAAAKASYIGLLENTISQGTFDTLRDSLHALRDEAPANVKDDWATFSKAADDFNTALEKDGMTIDDVAAMQNDPNMDQGPTMDQVMSAAAELSSLRTARALSAIGIEAQKDCNVNLN